MRICSTGESKAEFTACPSETESDSDNAEGTEGEDKVSATSVMILLFIQVKTVSILWQAAKSINYESQRKIFSF